MKVSLAGGPQHRAVVDVSASELMNGHTVTQIDPITGQMRLGRYIHTSRSTDTLGQSLPVMSWAGWRT